MRQPPCWRYTREAAACSAAVPACHRQRTVGGELLGERRGWRS